LAGWIFMIENQTSTMIRKLSFCIALSCSISAIAQDSVKVLNLDQCIEIALSRNLTIKQNQNNLIAARSNRTQAYYNFLPNLNANYDYTFVRGSAINNSGEVVANDSDQSSPNLTSNLILFNAFSNHHLLNRRKHEFESSRHQLEDNRLTVQATVIRNYLNVLVDYENIRISDQRLDFLIEQLEREKKRVSVGVGDLETVYNFQAQVANEKLNNVNTRNQYQLDLLSLLQSIQIDYSQDVQLEPLNIEEVEILVEYDEFDVVLSDILAYSFQLKSSAENEIAAKAQLSQTKSSRYPTVSVFGQTQRNYSKTLGSEDDPSYFDQLNNNNRSILQAAVSIPIFSRYQTQNNIDNAKIGMLNAKLQNDQARLDVTNAAQSDYLDLVSAQTSFQTASENYEALSQTFSFIKKRFETGNTDFFNYLESLNNKNQAESQLVNAKYTILLRKRILDLYRGKQVIGK